MNDKITLIITTFNSENYFDTLWNSMPFHKVDKVIVVNGGNPYTKSYNLPDNKLIWIQHEKVKNIASARNDGLKIAQQLGNVHIFLCEDDMVCLDETIFEKYINAAKITGIEYFSFASYGWESGPVGARTPRHKIRYNDDLIIYFYKNMTNEFTYRSLRVLEDIGLYNEQMKSLFDAEWAYRFSTSRYGFGFWNFGDLSLSDSLIKNNPDAISRIDPNGNRWDTLQNDYKIFMAEHYVHVPNILAPSQEELISNLRSLACNKGGYGNL